MTVPLYKKSINQTSDGDILYILTWAGPHSIFARWRLPMRDQASGSSLLRKYQSAFIKSKKRTHTMMPVGCNLSWEGVIGRYGTAAETARLKGKIESYVQRNNDSLASPSVLWIRIGSDPKLLEGSGSGKNHSGTGTEQLLVRNEVEVNLLWKTGRIWQFLKKMLN